MIGKTNTAAYLEAALKGASLRQSVIANNIANLNTPGFRRHAVAFEKHLAEAIASGKDVDMGELRKQVFQPKNTPVDARGNDVALEVEVGEMVKNTSNYKAYMKLLTKLYQQMETAIQSR
jgi:flagellar basal-body rod protein FlgB